MRRLDTTYSTIEWSSDGALVTKRRLAAPDARHRFRNELRVNQLLLAQPPPVPTPRLVAHDARQLSLTFETASGEPIGPKYPLQLADQGLEGMIDLAKRLEEYEPRRRWLRRLNSVRRLRLAQRAELLTPDETSALVALASRVHTRLRFAHGDLTARNVLSSEAGMTLIDWEWAGLYPDGYELAFLWFSLADVVEARALVEQRLTSGEEAFLLSALLIQLWHLQWFVPPEFRAKHLDTRDNLIARLATIT